MARDFHTHAPSREIPSLVSSEIFLPGEPFVSLEMHPWKLPEIWSGIPDDFAQRLPVFSALGEIGADALRGPEMRVQRRYCRELLSLARDCRKPVVLHIVRAWQICREECREFALPFLIHGFRGKGELLCELWRLGFAVSFHPSVVRNDALLSLLRRPQGKFGFESDDDPGADIPRIIEVVQKKSGNGDLEKISDACFEEFVSYGKCG